MISLALFWSKSFWMNKKESTTLPLSFSSKGTMKREKWVVARSMMEVKTQMKTELMLCCHGKMFLEPKIIPEGLLRTWSLSEVGSFGIKEFSLVGFKVDDQSRCSCAARGKEMKMSKQGSFQHMHFFWSIGTLDLCCVIPARPFAWMGYWYMCRSRKMLLPVLLHTDRYRQQRSPAIANITTCAGTCNLGVMR